MVGAQIIARHVVNRAKPALGAPEKNDDNCFRVCKWWHGPGSQEAEFATHNSRLETHLDERGWDTGSRKALKDKGQEGRPLRKPGHTPSSAYMKELGNCKRSVSRRRSSSMASDREAAACTAASSRSCISSKDWGSPSTAASASSTESAS
jgi:hypothetical protein